MFATGNDVRDVAAAGQLRPQLGDQLRQFLCGFRIRLTQVCEPHAPLDLLGCFNVGSPGTELEFAL